MGSGDADTDRYLSTHGLHELMEFLLSRLMLEQPENPREVLAQMVEEAIAVRSGKKAPTSFFTREDIGAIFGLYDPGASAMVPPSAVESALRVVGADGAMGVSQDVAKFEFINKVHKAAENSIPFAAEFAAHSLPPPSCAVAADTEIHVKLRGPVAAPSDSRVQEFADGERTFQVGIAEGPSVEFIDAVLWGSGGGSSPASSPGSAVGSVATNAGDRTLVPNPDTIPWVSTDAPQHEREGVFAFTERGLLPKKCGSDAEAVVEPETLRAADGALVRIAGLEPCKKYYIRCEEVIPAMGKEPRKIVRVSQPVAVVTRPSGSDGELRVGSVWSGEALCDGERIPLHWRFGVRGPASWMEIMDEGSEDTHKIPFHTKSGFCFQVDGVQVGAGHPFGGPTVLRRETTTFRECGVLPPPGALKQYGADRIVTPQIPKHVELERKEGDSLEFVGGHAAPLEEGEAPTELVGAVHCPPFPKTATKAPESTLILTEVTVPATAPDSDDLAPWVSAFSATAVCKGKFFDDGKVIRGVYSRVEDDIITASGNFSVSLQQHS